jgi:hypothetical protein
VSTRSRAPLGLAGFLAVPLFFASLMAATLAVEKAHVFEWQRGGRLFRTMHPPVASMEAKIWLLALLPSLVLCLWGAIATRLPYGLYLAALGAIADSLAVTHRLALWERHHTARFPIGADLIPDSSTSSSLAKGEWEANARETAASLAHWTIALALAATLIAAALELRRRRGAPPVEAGPVEAAPGTLATGGAPQLTGPP